MIQQLSVQYLLFLLRANISIGVSDQCENLYSKYHSQGYHKVAARTDKQKNAFSHKIVANDESWNYYYELPFHSWRMQGTSTISEDEKMSGFILTLKNIQIP